MFLSVVSALPVCLLSTERYVFDVNENEPVGFKLGMLTIQDRDEKQNKKPVFTVENSYEDKFDLEPSDNNDGVLILKKVTFTSSFPTVHSSPLTSKTFSWQELDPVIIWL